MAEATLLDRTAAWLAGVELVPAPVLVGFAEPAVAGELPALVISLEEAARVRAGLGGRARTVEDAVLPVVTELRLDAAVLPGSPPLNLWTAATRTLSLPHGGLVRRDRALGPLQAGDVALRVNGDLWSLQPGAGPRYQVEGASGRVIFGQDPPADATIEVRYHLGRWEQRVVRLAGVLRIDVVAATLDQVRALSLAVLAQLEEAPIEGVLALDVRALSPVGSPEPGHGGRRRRLAFGVEFELLVDRPPSEGGVIQRIPLHTRLVSTTVRRDGTADVGLTVETRGGLPPGAVE